MFQHYAAFKHLSVFRNVAFGLEIRKRPKDEIRRRVQELLELVHLEQFADRLPSQLSGGQRQRMALARALAVEPTVLLLDEPFGALDAKVRKELREWLRRLHDEVHVTTVFVTHDQEEALEVADEIVVINDGRIEQIGSPDALYDEPANEFVMRFLGPVTQLGPYLVRPHDLELTTDATDGSVPGRVTRILRVGFEVRAEVATDDQVVLVTKTRPELGALGIEVGSSVDLRPIAGAPMVRVAAVARARPRAHRRRLTPAGSAGGPGLVGGGLLSDRTWELAGGEVGEGDGLQYGAQRGAGGHPERHEGLVDAVVGQLVGPDAADRRQRAFEHADDVGDRDLLRRSGQRPTALGPPVAAQEVGVAELPQDVIEELAGDVLLLGQAIALHRHARLLLEEPGQRGARADGVVDLVGDAHGLESPRREGMTY